MKCKSENKLLGVITASVLTLVLFMGMSISLTIYGAEQISYVERSWNGTQVYRLYNPSDSQHLYTISGGEYDVRGSEGWQKEGIAFRVI